MFTRIYFDNKPLFLCNATDGIIEKYIHHDDTVFIDELNSHAVKTMIHEMQNDHIHAGVFFHPDLDKLKKTFFKKFTLVRAAGGLVRNQKKHVLLIFRRGKWDLPKGKLDEGESLEECATREVTEETGVTGIKLISPLIITYHTYHEGTRYILKESHWYNMTVSNEPKLIPQAEESITDARWVDMADIKTYYENAFPSVIDVLEAGRSE